MQILIGRGGGFLVVVHENLRADTLPKKYLHENCRGKLFVQTIRMQTDSICPNLRKRSFGQILLTSVLSILEAQKI